MYDKFMIQRIRQLRKEKRVSARVMSQIIGQSDGYINTIERGRSLPSMQHFFDICDYFEITPMEFFDDGMASPAHLRELLAQAKSLDAMQLELLSQFIKSIKR